MRFAAVEAAECIRRPRLISLSCIVDLRNQGRAGDPTDMSLKPLQLAYRRKPGMPVKRARKRGARAEDVVRIICRIKTQQEQILLRTRMASFVACCAPCVFSVYKVIPKEDHSFH